ncbi:sorting nexin 1 [Actinidia rufa]|uniref:Sorting nexin 1 n=1 Tax=Actinidia rufa TaxID=165716 RepID=A0A7J0GEJ3_9ERIC|nr:sorting nexin 1 [Actinidia rufa]
MLRERRQPLPPRPNSGAVSLPSLLNSDSSEVIVTLAQTMPVFGSVSTDLRHRGPPSLIHSDSSVADVQSKVSDIVLGKEKPVEESKPEYEKLKHYIFELEDHLAEAQNHTYRLNWGNPYQILERQSSFLVLVKKNDLGKVFSELGAKSEILSIKLQKEAHHLLMNFEEPLKDYVRAVQSIKATMAERTNAFRQQCELAETIKLKEIDMNKLRLTRSEKLPEAERDYEVLKADSEEATSRFEMIGQAHLANSIADAWRSLLPKLEGCSSS